MEISEILGEEFDSYVMGFDVGMCLFVVDHDLADVYQLLPDQVQSSLPTIFFLTMA